ncbi:MAG: T9SS type A sorting domain-containing protein [Saprospiraceae bacterium]
MSLQFINAQGITVNPLPGCKGDTVNVLYTGNYSPNAVFNWTFSCGVITNPNLPNPHQAVLNTSSSNCNITVVITEPGQGPVTYTFDFEVFKLPTGKLGHDTVICEGTCTQLPITFTGNAPFTYSYRIANELFIDTAFTNRDTIMRCPVQNNNVFLMTLSDAYCDNINTLDTAFITVQPSFEASIMEFGIFTRAMPPGNQYGWYSCDFQQYYGAFQQWVLPGNGCYAVIVANGACVDTAYYSLCEIISSFSAPAQICAGASATYDFNGSAGPNAHLRWTIDKGNGQTQVIEDQDPIQVPYVKAGTYTVTLTVLENGCAISSVDTILVRPKPTIDLCCNDTICPNTCIVLNGPMTGMGNLQYVLKGPGGTHITGMGQAGTTAHIFVCPPATGWYRIDSIKDVAGCLTLRADSVRLSLYPAVVGSLSVADNIITASPSGLTYTWQKCNDSNTLATSQTFAPGASGCYRAIFFNGTCKDTVEIDFQYCTLACGLAVPATACAGNPVALTFNGTVPQGTELTWVVKKASEVIQTFTGIGPHTFSPPAGCYEVSLQQVFLQCELTCLDTFCVVAKPTATLCCAQELCQGDCKTLNISLSGKSPWSFQLQEGATLIPFSNISTTNYATTLCPTSTKSYLISQLVDANGCAGVLSNSVEFKVKLGPKASVQMVNDSVCAFPESQSYGWYDCSGSLYFTTERCIKPLQGCYCVDVINAEECKDSACLNFIPTGINDLNESGFTIFPNPIVDGKLSIQIQSSGTESGLLRLWDLTGRLLHSQTLDFPSGAMKQVEIPVANAGIYLISIDLNGKSYVRKVVLK